MIEGKINNIATAAVEAEDEKLYWLLAALPPNLVSDIFSIWHPLSKVMPFERENRYRRMSRS